MGTMSIITLLIPNKIEITVLVLLVGNNEQNFNLFGLRSALETRLSNEPGWVFENNTTITLSD